jgi:hypothetical protein
MKLRNCRADLVASCLRGAFPPVDLRAVCFVRAMAGKRLYRTEVAQVRMQHHESDGKGEHT